MSRCVVSVGTGRYKPGIARLKNMELGCAARFWEEIPTGCPTHSEVPYAFKAHAIEHASKEHDVLLWMDASVVPVANLRPLWRKIEADGYWFALNGWTNYEWTATNVYPLLFPDMPLVEAQKINREIPHVVATAFGVSLKNPTGKTFLEEYCRLARTKAFCGPWGNSNNPEAPQYPPSMMGPCGPKDVRGHRHDQTAASVLAWRLGMALTPCPEFFSYTEGDPRTVLVAKGV